MNAKTLEAVKRHGETLLRVFPNTIEKNPVALCKKLRRIESSLQKPITDYCNGVNITAEELDQVCEKSKVRAVGLLGGFSSDIIFINRDPRGCALKIDDVWAREFNHKQYSAKLPSLYTDMGGYGIIAPDLTA